MEFIEGEEYDEFLSKQFDKSDELKHIVDYYDTLVKWPFKVKKFIFKVESWLNQHPLGYRNVNFNKHDSLEVKYKFKDAGLIKKNEYMDFLHNAHKFDEMLISSQSANVWQGGYMPLSMI